MDDEARRARVHRTMDQALDCVLAHDMAGFAVLWALDGTMTFPFAPPGAPTHLAGRAAVADYVAGYNDFLLPERVAEQMRHDTGDPDTVVVEFAVEGTIAKGGKPYCFAYVAVVTVGDEGITSYRDYWNPAAAADFLGSVGAS